MRLKTYFRPLRRWWWLLVASGLLAAISSFISVRQQPPLYVATTTLIIGRSFDNPNPTGNELALSQQLAETYADLAYRRPIREQTMAALGLTRLPEYNAHTLPNQQLLEIAVIDTDPQRAKAVADELANQLILGSPTAPKPEEQERDAFINSQLASLEVHIRQTEAEMIAKQTELESAFGANEISELQSQLAALQTKLSTLQSNYSGLLANTKGGAINTIEVIEPARVPETPTDSGKWQLVLVVTAIAVILAAGTAYLLEYLDDTVRTADDLSRVNGFAKLPSIPEFRWNGNIIPVLARVATRTPVTDAFRALRTGLYAATAAKPGNVFLITSAVPGEGKSTVAANLATVLAHGNKSVLLIDADLRRPSQHKLFDLAESDGLAELLTELERHGPANSREDLIQHAIQKIGPMRLSLISAGVDLADTAGLLGSDTMKLLLQTVSQQVDYVIIDSPPLLAVADALMLSIQVDGVVVVAGAGSIHRKQLEQTLHSLQDVNANVIGIVLNRQKAGTDGYAFPNYGAYTN
jgi:capsular exopolysaccharide synthesis family protein